ncbi:MAG TPA: hypothetical protein VFM34_01025 [Moraxellaceae bacterium]|nr:hypothetical protein [Moraxellaceae bacterium]
MKFPPPYIAVPLRSHIADGLAMLTERARTRLGDGDKKLGAQLLADAYCDVLDHVFFELLYEINRTHPSPLMKEAIGIGDEIKSRIHSSLGWVIGFFSSERIIPVINHFNELTHAADQEGGRLHSTVFPLGADLASRSQRVLRELADGSAKDLNEGVELLIEVLDAALEPLVFQPKRLMKFNFFVNKTLDGVISLVHPLFKRMLRRIGAQVPRELYPKVSAHFAKFLVTAP